VGSKARFGSISDLGAGPDSVLYLADQERHQVKAVLLGGHLPTLTPQAWSNELCIDNQASTCWRLWIKNAPNGSNLKGLSHEIDFKNFDKNLQNLT
jgi:hypothetical protein